MEAKELMIGDFVRNHRTKETEWVFEIDDDRDVINNEPDGICSERNILISSVEPIPLTPEILEKNDFIRYSNIGTLYYTYSSVFNNQPYIEIHFIKSSNGELADWKSDEKLWIKIRKDEYNIINVQLCYVHELQHALRLCGLNELADNFKI